MWVFCLSHLHASNFSLIKDYKLIVNQTEIKIRQVEIQIQPLSKQSVNISLSNNNSVYVSDYSDKALVFSVDYSKSENCLVLKDFKEKCLDNLIKSSCLDEFIEKFYTLFDPFGMEYQFNSRNGPMLAKLVKDVPEEGLNVFPNPVVNNNLYLQKPGEKIGPVKVYDIRSGQEVFSTNVDDSQISLDLANLKRGNYILVCGEDKIRFIK